VQLDECKLHMNHLTLQSLNLIISTINIYNITTVDIGSNRFYNLLISELADMWINHKGPIGNLRIYKKLDCKVDRLGKCSGGFLSFINYTIF
jgi:hypothetical protein